MYTRSYNAPDRPFHIPPHYGGSTFGSTPPAPPPRDPPLEGILQPLQSLFGGTLSTPGSPGFDELLLLGLIFLLSESERGKEIIPILVLLLFCGGT